MANKMIAGERSSSGGAGSVEVHQKSVCQQPSIQSDQIHNPSISINNNQRSTADLIFRHQASSTISDLPSGDLALASVEGSHSSSTEGPNFLPTAEGLLEGILLPSFDLAFSNNQEHHQIHSALSSLTPLLSPITTTPPLVESSPSLAFPHQHHNSVAVEQPQFIARQNLPQPKSNSEPDSDFEYDLYNEGKAKKKVWVFNRFLIKLKR